MHGFQCDLHPSKQTVGICPSCLRERLQILKSRSKNTDLKGDGTFSGGDGIRQRNLRWEDIYGREKVAKAKRKKERKIMNFSGLRWLFCFKDSKPKRNKNEEKDRPRDLGEVCFPAEGRRSLWISSVVAMSDRSVLRRSRSSFEHELLPFYPGQENSGKQSFYFKTKSTDSNVKRSTPDQGKSTRRYRRDEELLNSNESFLNYRYGGGHTESSNGLKKLRQRSSRKPDM